MNDNIQIFGIPAGADKIASAVFRSRLLSAYQDFSAKIGSSPQIGIGEPPWKQDADTSRSERTAAEPSPQKVSLLDPLYSFEQLILPHDTYESLMQSVQVMSVEDLVFNQWGLKKIEPHSKAALNFYGPPGTGKTLAAHAIANFLKKKILIASYAEIESKYHGDGPKNVKKIFFDAEQSGAVLFIDEADSLLSKRLTNVTQGSEQAINSMRSQLLICLEQFHGVVIFATNLVKNYDKAFETRIQHVEFQMPDRECRRKIWESHFPATLPLADDVSPEKLADIDDICGRDIRNAIIQAAVKAALEKRIVNYTDIKSSIDKIKRSRVIGEKNESTPLTKKEKDFFVKKARKAIKKYKQQRRR